MTIKSIVDNIPVKKGQRVELIPVQQIQLVEANDKFSFVYNIQGDKILCDYPLGYLTEKLPPDFIRVHRKYIVNVKHLQHIESYGNGKYVLSFTYGGLPSVISSQSYHEDIKALIKI